MRSGTVATLAQNVNANGVSGSLHGAGGDTNDTQWNIGRVVLCINLLAGSLVVNLAPDAANSAGAQWQVDGGSYHNSGDTAAGLTPGSHSISFKTVSGYTAPADVPANIVAGQQTAINATYAVVVASTYTLTLNYDDVQGSVSASPTPSGSIYTAGTAVQLTASANVGYHFTSWSGDATGTANPTTITMDGNKSVTANFASGDPNLGTVGVTILPPAAAAAGVKWGWNAHDFRDSGTSYTTWPGGYWIVMHTVDGWLGPAMQPITVTAGQTLTYTVTFTPDTTPGLLTVTLSPPSAAAAGAWHVNGGAAQASGATVSLPPGANYSLTFDPVPGWIAPAPRTVSVPRGQTTFVSANYSPPVGQPVIAAVHPSIGPLEGTLVTIDGVNFTAPTTVLIGDHPATNITVLSATQISCFAPSNSAFGTVPVVVQTAGGSATNLNGFTYALSSGNWLERVNAVGGGAFGLAVRGNYAYLGEGNALLVVNIANPASPFIVGRLLLPGEAWKIKVSASGQYAYVAAHAAGLLVVDISNPAAPLLKGAYATSASSTSSSAFLAGRAYVADEIAGLQVFDLGNPTVPILLSATNLGGYAYDVEVKATASGVFAYICVGASLVICDVSDPLLPKIRSRLAFSGLASGIAVVGTRAFVAAQTAGLNMVDVSNPDAPVSLGRDLNNAYPESVAVANNLVYAGGLLTSTMAFRVFDYSGGSLGLVGGTGDFTGRGNLVVSGTHAFWAAGGEGLHVVDVSAPANPLRLGTFSDSGLYGHYYSVGASGNLLCASVNSDFKVFDVSTPDSPVLRGQSTGIGGNTVMVRNGVAYMGSSIISLTNPASPQVIFTIPSGVLYQNFGMGLVGNTLCAAGDTTISGTLRLVTMDVTDPAHPVTRGTNDFKPFDTVTCFAAAGSNAIVGVRNGSNTNRLKVFDISNPKSPLERGSVAMRTNILRFYARLSADTKYAYVVDLDNNAMLHIFNLTNPANPTLVTNFALGNGPGQSLELRGTELFVGTYKRIHVFDVSNPTAPLLTRQYTMNAQGVTLSSNDSGIVYVAGGWEGLVVLRETDREPPVVIITNPTFSPVATNTTGLLNLGGVASDNSSLARITWSNNRGGGGELVGLSDWLVNGIALLPGTNLLTVTAFDLIGNSGADTLTVIYQPPAQGQTITFPALTDKTFGDPPIPLIAAASSGLPVGFSVVSGSATVSNGVLTLTGAGPVAVRATQSGNSQFNPASAVTNSFTVAKADQGITFGLLSDKLLGDAPFPLNATAGSGLPVSFGIVSGPASLSNNIVTLTGAGTVVIRASQAGNANINAALDVERSFVVAKLPQFITFGALSRQVFGDAPFALSASASSGLPVTFSVLSGPAVVSGNILTMTGAGMVVLRASQSGDATYTPAPNADQVLIVVPGNNVITDFQRLASGMFTFHFYGEPGTDYVVQGSTNLVNWLSLATNQVNGLGYVEFTDTSATNYSKRFYRIAPLSAVSSGGPVIGLQLVGDNMVPSWPTNWPGFSLESATNLPAASCKGVAH